MSDDLAGLTGPWTPIGRVKYLREYLKELIPLLRPHMGKQMSSAAYDALHLPVKMKYGWDARDAAYRVLWRAFLAHGPGIFICPDMWDIAPASAWAPLEEFLGAGEAAFLLGGLTAMIGTS